MPIYLIMFVAAAGLGLIAGAIGIVLLVQGSRRTHAVWYYVSAIILLAFAAAACFAAWQITTIRIPPGG